MLNNVVKLTSLLIVMILTYANAFVNGVPTCDSYTLNTYLYILLGLITVFVSTKTITDNNIKIPSHWITFIVSFASLIAVILMNPKMIIEKHIAWFIFLVTTAMSMVPLYKSYSKDAITQTFLSTILIVLCMSGIVYTNPDLIDSSWSSILTIILLAGVILEMVNLFLMKSNSLKKWMSYGFVVLFSVFLLVDTKQIKERAEKCKDNADYPKGSLDVILDVINLFVRLLSFRRRK